MRTSRFTSCAGTVAAIALTAAVSLGCAQSGAPSASSDPAADKQSVVAEHEMHEAPGPEMLVFAALHRLDLKPEQRAAIAKAMQAIPPRIPGDRTLFAALAASVRAGRIDEAALLAKLDAAGPAADRTAALVSAIDTLHATLSADQRQALVEIVATHIDEQDAMDGAASRPSPIDHLLSNLTVTSDQRASIDRIVTSANAEQGLAAAAARMQAFHAGIRTRIQSFTDDRFDAGAFVGVWKEVEPMRNHIQRNLHALAAVLPVLDATQRGALAAAIEAGPSHGH